MGEISIIALVILAFIAGAVVGVILISMCFSNNAYDESEAAYKLGIQEGVQQGRDEIRREMEDLCSHCCYKRED